MMKTVTSCMRTKPLTNPKFSNISALLMTTVLFWIKR